ncbi:MAG: hypothetical protein L3K15_00465 [Thermoplasmata archaeon]|nr:hypothetical protein [Thermoplasmata archaeon]
MDRVVAGRVCPVCGHLNPPLAEWCESCARRLPTPAADLPAAGYGRSLDTDQAGVGAASVRRLRRWVIVALLLGVVGLVLGASALLLPFAVPGYAGSFAHHPPMTIYDRAFAAPVTRHCISPSPPPCTSYDTIVVGFDNASVPGSPSGLALVNLSYQLNRSCSTCILEVFHGNVSTGGGLLGNNQILFLFVNGTGNVTGTLAGGTDQMVLVNELTYGPSGGPVTLHLKIVYLGQLLYS